MIVPIFNSMAPHRQALFEAARRRRAPAASTIMRLIVVPLCKSGIALGSIFVISIVMGDFFVVKVMSGGGSASVVGAFYEDIGSAAISDRSGQRHHPDAHRVVAGGRAILRTVDIRKELTR